MKLHSKISMCLVMAAFMVSSCQTKTDEAPADMEKVKVEIQAMEDAFSAGEKAKDADAVAAYYADDAISYGRNKAPEVGKVAIREAIAKNIASDSTGDFNVYKVVDVFGEGDMVVEVGSWNSFKSDGSEKDNGYYMSYFQKRDGKYVCVRDMNVSTTPASKPAM
jgi:ketosteroid isomerase-like protein